MSDLEAAVLVVEDDGDIREALVQLLEMRGHRVLVAENGLEALELLQKLPSPWLILLDQMMPFMDGYTLMSRMKETPHLARIPVILLSGNYDLDRALKAGATHLVRKPFEMKALLKLVSEQQDLRG